MSSIGKLEYEALDAAYSKAFGRLFDVLMSGWSAEPITSMERFRKGLDNQREAYWEVMAILDKEHSDSDA